MQSEFYLNMAAPHPQITTTMTWSRSFAAGARQRFFTLACWLLYRVGPHLPCSRLHPLGPQQGLAHSRCSVNVCQARGLNLPPSLAKVHLGNETGFKSWQVRKYICKLGNKTER